MLTARETWCSLSAERKRGEHRGVGLVPSGPSDVRPRSRDRFSWGLVLLAAWLMVSTAGAQVPPGAAPSAGPPGPPGGPPGIGGGNAGPQNPGPQNPGPPNGAAANPEGGANVPAGNVPGGSVRYSVVPAGPGGLYVYVPGQWGMVNVNVANPSKEPAELRCATYFEREPSLQFGRKIWLPPESRMKVSHPIYVPDGYSEPTINYRSIVENSGKLVREDTSQVLHSGSFFTMLKRPITGLIEDLERETEDPKNPPYDLVVACRVKAGNTRQIANLQDDFLPPDEESYRPIDQLIISSSRVLNDQAGLSAIREWVGGGGRLWLMIDSVDPELLSAFFGDDWKGQYVDRTYLAEVKIEPTIPTLSNPSELIRYDEPIPFVRVVTTPQEEVWYTVNGWPAAFWKTYGAGRVLVTTLSPKGWMGLNASTSAAAERARQENIQAARFGQEGLPPLKEEPAAPAPPPEPPQPAGRPGAMNPAAASNNPAETSLFVPNEPMMRLASEFMGARPPEASVESLVAEQAGDYIGYKIPARDRVLGVLFGFVAALALAAIALWRTNRLQHLGWFVPLLALLAGGSLVWLGNQSRTSSPSALSVVQLINGIPGSHDYQSNGFGAVYSPDGKETELGSTQGGRVMLNMDGGSLANRRMEWTDLGKWSWVNLPQPPGQRAMTMTRSGTTRKPFIADATFGPEGLTGQLQLGDAQGVSDAVISTTWGRIGVRLSPDGTFVAAADDVLTSNQYLASQFLSDEQARRQKTLKKVLESVDSVARKVPVQIFAWSEPWVDGLVLDPQRTVKGSALVQMPLSITRPAPGVDYLIPSPMLPFRNQRGAGPDGLTSSPIWNFVKNEGADRDLPGTAWFVFEPPASLLPFEAVSARLRVDVSGPMGKLEIAGWKNGELKVLKEWIDPVGQMELLIDDPEVLKVSDGGVLLRVSAGDPARPELTQRKEDGKVIKSTWKIESLKIDLKARSLAAGEG
jgi:hypothetical protein